MKKMTHMQGQTASNEREVNELARYRAEMLTLGFFA